MGKRLGNALYLSDTPEEIWSKVKVAVTDPEKIHLHDPGHPEICNVYKYHCVFNKEEAPNLCQMCQHGDLGCVACKKRLNEVLNQLLDPMRERRAYYAQHLDEVKDILVKGSQRCNEIGNKNLVEIKDKMHIMVK